MVLSCEGAGGRAMAAESSLSTSQVDHVVGDRVRIERDETRYPSRGTWPQFRDRTGTVVLINRDRKRQARNEYGVTFAKVGVRADRQATFNWNSAAVTWFKSYELTPARRVASQRHAGASFGAPEGNHP